MSPRIDDAFPGRFLAVAILAFACYAMLCNRPPKPPAGLEPLGASTTLLDYRSSLTVTFNDVDVDHGWQTIRGAVTNNGNRTVTYWKVAVRFFDGAKAVVDTDSLARMERLGPGDTKQWELLHRDDKRVRNFTFAIEDAIVE